MARCVGQGHKRSFGRHVLPADLIFDDCITACKPALIRQAVKILAWPYGAAYGARSYLVKAIEQSAL